MIHSSTNYSPLNGVNIVKMFLKIRTNHDDICRVTTGQSKVYLMIYCLVYKATAFMIKYQEFWNYSHGLKKFI